MRNSSRTAFKDIRIMDLIGILISSLFYFILSYLTATYTEERLLNEGAKELIAVINSKTFFFLHPERMFMFITQLFPYIGIKLGGSLKLIVYLYSFNFILVSFSIYLICVYYKDYYAGIFLAALQLIGFYYNFYLYPFLEHLYAATFSYVLFHILKSYKQGNIWQPIITIPLSILVITFHPACIFYWVLLIIHLNFSTKQKLLLGFYGMIVWVTALFYTEISINSRAGGLSLSIIPKMLSLFIHNHPDLIILLAMTLITIIIKKKNTLILMALVIASSAPYIFYEQIPTYYFILPTGLSLLYFAINESLKTNPLIVGTICVLFIFNFILINKIGGTYSSIHNTITDIISSARSKSGAKYIAIKDWEAESNFDNKYYFPLSESIKHSSLLLSSLNGPGGTVIIESYDFNKKVFRDFKIKQNKSDTDADIINFISGLYDSTTSNTLYPEYYNNYEYSKYFFTNKYINRRYFGINEEDKYQLITLENKFSDQ